MYPGIQGRSPKKIRIMVDWLILCTDFECTVSVDMRLRVTVLCTKL